MNLMTKVSGLGYLHYLLLALLTFTTNSFAAQQLNQQHQEQSSQLSEQLVRIVAYAYNERQGQGNFFQDSLEGIVAFLYVESSMQGRIELIDVHTQHGSLHEQVVSSFYYNLRAPELIYSRFKQQVLPAHFRGEMGPLLIAYQTGEDISLIWYAHGQEQLLLSGLEQMPMIGYLGENRYKVVIPSGDAGYNYHYFNAETGNLSLAFNGVISIEESLGLVLFSPHESNKLYLSYLFNNDPQLVKALDLEEFNQKLPIHEVIQELEWRKHTHEGETWAQIVLRFVTDRNMLSRAFYHSQTGERIYF